MENDAPSSKEQITAPWSGRALMPSEVARLLARTPARVIAVVGPYNAGKTCLLTSFFLQLATGQRGTFPYRFASSLTLHAFQELTAGADHWSGAPVENVVPHTTFADQLTPRSFLHLGLRPIAPNDDRHVDVLLSDLPGEWFKNWSSHVDETTKQRMGFIQRCDAFMVVVDASALLAPEGSGRVDSESSLVIRRIIQVTREFAPRPPLTLVFSKFDRVVGEVLPPIGQEDRVRPEAWGKLGARAKRTWLALEEARRASLPLHVFPISAFPHRLEDGQPVGVLAPFVHVMNLIDSGEPYSPLHPPVPEGARGFATLRRWR